MKKTPVNKLITGAFFVGSQFMGSNAATTSHQGIVDFNRVQFPNNPKTR